MPHDFSSTQVNLSGDVAEAIKKLGKQIPDSDLATPPTSWSSGARETEPHVTIKYGLHTSSPSHVKEVIKGEKPISLKLGKTSLFPPNKEEGFEVVKVEVHSPDLHRLNKKIAKLPHTDTYPDYKPHATVAYVKIGKGKKYIGKSLGDSTFTADHVIFSSRTGSKVPIKLGSSGRRYYGEKV